jgi:hypothetical protein
MNNNHQSAVSNQQSSISTIPEAIEAAQAEVTEISPSQLAHLQRVYAERQKAEQNLQKAIAEQQLCLGALNSFMVFLFAEYALDKKTDTIELETGKINRKS